MANLNSVFLIMTLLEAKIGAVEQFLNFSHNCPLTHTSQIIVHFKHLKRYLFFSFLSQMPLGHRIPDWVSPLPETFSGMSSQQAPHT